ncbi:MAG: hypothetical protein EOP05_11335 [Proteobacteria bacterium]|nr:MAG: hypothetical protein EOP05_11335 [Pseudomonadota bacterium]
MKSRNRLLARSIFLALISVHASPASAGSGSVIGNGGDPIFEFLQAARSSLSETVKVVLNDPNERKSFCTISRLNSGQIELCRKYFFETANQILDLNQLKPVHSPTDFVLRQDPLYVIGHDGKPMVVAAKTDLGKYGSIEFHRDSVKTLLPTQVLFLLAHEFQHKTTFEGRSVSDNESVPPFMNGRDLLDTVATALVEVAKRRGKVGTNFGIRDIFNCEARTSQTFGARISSSRRFHNEDLMAYESSIGKNPSDGTIYLPVDSKSTLALRYMMFEPNNCGDPNPDRVGVVQIVETKLEGGNTSEIVRASKPLVTNPICPGSSGRFEIETADVKFSCQYFGSEGTTSSQYSVQRAKR